MEQYLDQLLEWIRLHPHWAGIMVLIVSALESLLIVGLLVPGTVIMFAVGAMVASGQMELIPTLIWAITGAILGDGTSYLIGRHYHQRLRVIWPFRNYPKMMAQGVDFFHRHGGKSILLARFVGPVRPLVPAIAGMLDMPPQRFFLVNVLSALVWAPAYMAPGILFGASLGLAAEVAGRLALVLGLLFGLLWFFWWLVRRISRSLQPHTTSAQMHILAWSQQHPLIHPLTAALLDPNHPEARGMTILTGILVAASWILLATMQQLTPGSLLGNLDLIAFNELQQLRTPFADQWLFRITRVGNSLPLYGFTLLIAAWLLWHHYWRAVVHWLLAIAGVTLLTQALKHYTMVSRPIEELNSIIGFAFPSGHASLSLVVFGFLAVVVARELHPNWRWAAYSAAVFPVVAISFTRVYLGAHWVSDILGGWSLSLVWITLLGIAYRGHPAPAIPIRKLLPVISVAFGLLLLLSSLLPATQDAAYPAIEDSQQTLILDEWLHESWQQLPVYRNDMRGQHHHPLNLQWAGSLQQLEQHLTTRGWHEPVALGVKSFFAMFTGHPDINKLPVLPQIHSGSDQDLLLVKPAQDPNRLLVVRFWPSHFRLETSNQPVWVGNTSFLETRSQTGLFSLLRTGNDFDTPIQLFKQDVHQLIRNSRHTTPHQQATLPWKGEVILMTD
jgi:undecaprenyl-diphosphatase